MSAEQSPGACERATVNATERLPPHFSFSKCQLRLMEDFISGAATPFRIYTKEESVWLLNYRILNLLFTGIHGLTQNKPERYESRTTEQVSVLILQKLQSPGE